MWWFDIPHNLPLPILVPRSEAIGNKQASHALIEMVEPTRQSRLTGEDFKPLRGAVVKSYDVERLRKGSPMGCQVRLKEMSASEPLMKYQENAIFS